MSRLPHYFNVWFQGLTIMELNMNKYNLPSNEGRIYEDDVHGMHK